MEWETFKAIVEEGGGFDNIALLVFDNSILIVNHEAKSCTEEDFAQLGGEWCYKEKLFVRDKRTYEYTLPLINYHPFSCLQSVVMGDIKNADEQSVDDMF
jgi:hypothetical protein